tara:strand:- start:135 stop:1412 length:1278 start_codon:yes stop_codon:yes gene_type:complete
MYLRISNDNEINYKAFTLVGASTKTGSETIGQFGTGNKYALAYLLRNNHKVRIFSGETEIPISTKEESFGSEKFNVIQINNEPTSITTKMGKEWKLWQAIREFYSNALDEGNAEISCTTKIEGIACRTNIYISLTDELVDMVTKDFHLYFADESLAIYENEHGKIYENNGKTVVYRKGIKCFETNKNSLYSYDIPNVEINESRVAKYSWCVNRDIWKIILTCTDKGIIKNILTNLVGNNIEFDFESSYGVKISKEFIEVCTEINVQPAGLISLLNVNEVSGYTFLPEGLYSHISSKLVDNEQLKDLRFDSSRGVQYRIIGEPSELQMNTIHSAENFLAECDLPCEYDIVVGKFSDSNILGYADKDGDYIVLSETGLERGIHDVVNTIIEEYIHLKHDVRDCTREFQLHAIDMLINYAKKKNSYNI